MNKYRRKEIQEIINSITYLKIELEKNECDQIYVEEERVSIYEAIEMVMADEEMSMDFVPENLHSSDKYMKMEDAVDNLDNALFEFENFTTIEDLNSVINYLEIAKI